MASSGFGKSNDSILTVENIAWKHRQLFRPEVGSAAASRLASAGFDV